MLYSILGIMVLDALTNYTVLNSLINRFSYDIIESGYKAKYDDLASILYRTDRVNKVTIPIYGTILTLITTYKYRKKKNIILEHLRSTDSLERLTIEERNVFNNNPTKETAVGICKKFENDINNSTVWTYIDENNQTSTVWYTISGNENDFKIDIHMVLGPLKSKSYSEISNLVLNKWIEVYNSASIYTNENISSKKYENMQVQDKKELLNSKKDVSIIINNIINELNTKSQTQKLTKEEIELKEELIKELKNINKDVCEITKTLVKKK